MIESRIGRQSCKDTIGQGAKAYCKIEVNPPLHNAGQIVIGLQ